MIPLRLPVEFLSTCQGRLAVWLGTPALRRLAIGFELLLGAEAFEKGESMKRALGLARIAAGVFMAGGRNLAIFVGNVCLYLGKGGRHCCCSAVPDSLGGEFHKGT